MHRYCVIFCIIVLVNLSIKNANGQTNTTSNSTQLTTNIKPVTNSNIYETEGFTSDIITSGPVLIIDKKTLFISNLNYVSKSSDTFFWTGVGEPSSNGVLVPDENNSKNPLKSYAAKNIYLQLPENLTTDKIDYIAVWSVKYKTDLGRVILYKENNTEARNSVPDALGYHNKTKDNKEIFRIPFCCGKNEIFSTNTKNCIPVEDELTFDMTVFESNETHIDPDQILSNIEFVPYKYFANCKKNFIRVVLDVEEILGFIYNSSLLYYVAPNDYGILSHGSFCVLYFNVSPQEIVICADNGTLTVGASIQYLYLPFLIISTICFFTSAVIYIFLLRAKDIHGKCFVGYSISMTVTFMCLICLQKMSAGCNFTGGLFMFSMICSFVWLACLCIDLIYVVKSNGSRTEDDIRIYIYLSIAMIVPVIVLMISLIPDGIPDVPKSFVKTYSGTDACSFNNVKIGKFFIPIGLLILASLGGLGYTSYIINHNNDNKDNEWMRNKGHFKFMLIQCILIWITMTLSFVAWLLLNLLEVDEKPEGVLLSLVLLQYMQGLLFILINFGHKWSNKVIEKRKCKIKNQRGGNCQILYNGNFEMIPLNGQGKE